MIPVRNVIPQRKCEYQDAPPESTQECCVCFESFNSTTHRRVVHLKDDPDKKFHAICRVCFDKTYPPNCVICRDPLDRASIYSFKERIQVQVVPFIITQVVPFVITVVRGTVEGLVKKCLFLAKNITFLIASGSILENSTVQLLSQQYKQRIPIGCNFLRLIIFLSSFVGLKAIFTIVSEIPRGIFKLRDRIRINRLPREEAVLQVKSILQTLYVCLQGITLFPFKKCAKEYALNIAKFSILLFYITEKPKNPNALIINVGFDLLLGISMAMIATTVQNYVLTQLNIIYLKKQTDLLRDDVENIERRNQAFIELAQRANINLFS